MFDGKIPEYVARSLESLSRKAPVATWKDGVNKEIYELDLRLGGKFEASARLHMTQKYKPILGSIGYPGCKYLAIGSFEILDKELEGYGVGKRMLRVIAAEAKKRGADLIYDYIASPEGLAVKKKVFGDNVRVLAKPRENVRLGTKYEDVLSSFNSYKNVYTITDLRKEDTSDWEMPEYSEKSVWGNELTIRI